MTFQELAACMTRRHSTRTFSSRDVGPHLLQTLDDAARAAIAASPVKGRFTIRHMELSEARAVRQASYGVIKGARHYLLMFADATPRNRMGAAFVMEQVVLEATRLGLGTCWLGGTFRTSAFDADSLHINPGEELQIVIPVGYEAESPRLTDRLFRTLAHSSRRKPFDELFTGCTALWREPLEMMRLAPSARNIQPWRAEATEHEVRFTAAADGKFTTIDMGIALCHFTLAAKALGVGGDLLAEPETNSARWVLK